MLGLIWARNQFPSPSPLKHIIVRGGNIMTPVGGTHCHIVSNINNLGQYMPLTMLVNHFKVLPCILFLS